MIERGSSPSIRTAAPVNGRFTVERIHFVHVGSKEPNALPVIITHCWPGSVIEQLKVIDPLTNPTAFGGSARTHSTS